MAAQLQIPSIHPFSPHGESSQVAQKWSKWKKSFQYFVTASGVRDDGRRKALLLHLVGQQTQEVFETLGVADDATYQVSLDAFDGHFDMQRNVSFERSVFHNAKQKENESIEQYVTRLRRLAQYCEYNDIVEEQIRDQVVATCNSSNSILSCTRCGAKGHQGNQCRRSRGKKCLTCGKFGHFSVMCRSSSKENSRRNQQLTPNTQDFRKYNTQKINQLHAEFEDDDDVNFFLHSGRYAEW